MSTEITATASDDLWRHGWSNKALNRLVVVLVVSAAVEGWIGGADLLRYARDIPTLTGAMIWIGAAILSAAAAVAIQSHKPWWPSAVLGAQALALVLAAYVLWVELTSPYTDLWLRLIALAPIVIAVVTIPRLCVSSGALPGKVWAGALAAITALGLSQFVLEDQILPNRAPPPLDVTAQLEEIGRTGDFHVLRGRVTWKNNGKARALVLGALATVVARSTARAPADVDVPDPGPAAPPAPSAAPPAAPGPDARDQSVSSPNGALGEEQPTDTDSTRLLAMAKSIDPLHYASGVYEASLESDQEGGIVWMEDLTVPRWFVLPGQSESREFTLAVDGTQVASLELRVDAWFATNLSHEPWRTCTSGTELTNRAFLTEFHDVSQRSPRACLMAPIKPTNFVRSLADDEPFVWIEYLLENNGYFGGLVAYFGSEDSSQAVGEDEVEKINRTRPVAGAAVIAAWATSETVAGG